MRLRRAMLSNLLLSALRSILILRRRLTDIGYSTCLTPSSCCLLLSASKILSVSAMCSCTRLSGLVCLLSFTTRLFLSDVACPDLDRIDNGGGFVMIPTAHDFCAFGTTDPTLGTGVPLLSQEECRDSVLQRLIERQVM